MAAVNIPPISMEIITKIIVETVEKLREEDIYPALWIKDPFMDPFIRHQARTNFYWGGGGN